MGQGGRGGGPSSAGAGAVAEPRVLDVGVGRCAGSGLPHTAAQVALGHALRLRAAEDHELPPGLRVHPRPRSLPAVREEMPGVQWFAGAGIALFSKLCIQCVGKEFYVYTGFLFL